MKRDNTPHCHRIYVLYCVFSRALYILMVIETYVERKASYFQRGLQFIP